MCAGISYAQYAPHWGIGFQGAWIWVQDKAEICRHITHMASISNAVMGPKTGHMTAKNSGATDIKSEFGIQRTDEAA
jgi:hypothetical protein